MSGWYPTKILMEQNTKFKNEEGGSLDSPAIYWFLFRRLMCLTISRVDFFFVVNTLNQFMQTPHKSHLEAVFHILRYLKGQSRKDIIFKFSKFDFLYKFLLAWVFNNSFLRE